jgi:hypothetical protein
LTRSTSPLGAASSVMGLPVALDGVDRQGWPVARTALLWP